MVSRVDLYLWHFLIIFICIWVIGRLCLWLALDEDGDKSQSCMLYHIPVVAVVVVVVARL